MAAADGALELADLRRLGAPDGSVSQHHVRADLTTLGLPADAGTIGGGDSENKEGLDNEQEDQGPLVLVCGDGDCSYTLSLAILLQRENRRARIVGTTLDTAEEMLKYKRYPAIRKRIEEEFSNVRLVHGVDARKIEGDKQREIFGEGPPYAQFVLFNFPHYGGQSKVQVNRKLLGDFFLCARQFIRAGEGQIWVSLISGQGGTQAERFKRLLWANTWQVQDQAAQAGLLMKDVEPAQPALYRLAKADSELGYRSRGYKDGDAGFHQVGSITHKFAWPHPTFCPRARFPLVWEGSLGMYYDPDHFEPDELYSRLRKHLYGARFRAYAFDRYIEPWSRRMARTYRIEITSLEVPVSRMYVHQLMATLKTELLELEELYLDRYNLRRWSKTEMREARAAGILDVPRLAAEAGVAH
ncbi:Ferredoxin-fold anticodon-binding domain-containing protein 1 [Hondaea fermentalgiana]|uniref:Ferredoxin-fold anticodon-binding domain-containing protein 1 n=1 Tax=Hondaea fermentalgiana TaxID=2315210 RepID=A0A2R5GJL3_9STRA|nr:Ferredoxin-fold anticodon-binding domain-containing protein 1 [Hondaea fermentalgiana]|eukprot:GBG28843.1 Ferredoxin-fold anticodon-binding domain-containing protein 1 [Hondaea fermentalgiana]